MKKSMGIKSLEEDKSSTDWFDKNSSKTVYLSLTATNLITGIK